MVYLVMARTRQDFYWLNDTNGTHRAFHERAATARDQVFGRNVFVRGVVEVSNYCRENCQYCAMRRDNRSLTRYRLLADELAELIIHHRPASITDIDIQAGEDPVAVREVVLPLMREIRRHTDLGLTLCLGTLAPRDYDELREAGGQYYVLKIETGKAQHYHSIQAPGTLAQRLEAIRYLAGTGWKVSSGLIVGLPGQTNENLTQSLQLLTTLPLAGCSVSPFVAGEQTPLSGCAKRMHRSNPELRRLDATGLTPLAHPGGQRHEVGVRKRLRARFPGRRQSRHHQFHPPNVRADYPIYKRDRIIMDEERVLSAIQLAGCQPSLVGIAEHLRKDVSSPAVS